MLRTVPPRTPTPVKRCCRQVPARNTRDNTLECGAPISKPVILNFVIPSAARNLQRAELGHWDAANCPTPNANTCEALLPSSPSKKIPGQHTRTIPLPCSPNPVATSPLLPSESCPCLVAWPSQD